jgi:hypothetical protein
MIRFKQEKIRKIEEGIKAKEEKELLECRSQTRSLSARPKDKKSQSFM